MSTNGDGHLTYTIGAIDTAEYNPFECIATNVLGAENVINASIDGENIDASVCVLT